MFRIFRLSILSGALLSIMLSTSCRTTDPFAGAYSDSDDNVGPYTSALERDLQSYEGPARNPLIVLHGFLGAKLKNIDSGEEVWGEFTAAEAVRGFSDNFLKNLSYPMEYGKSLYDIKPKTIPYSMMTDVDIKVLGVKFDQSAYQDMLNIFISKGFIPEEKVKEKGKNFASLYPFYYDWRRNNVQNAQQLNKFIKEKRAELQKTYEKLYGIKDFDVKFNIVAHSMGGMITRYMLMYGDQEIPDKGPMPVPDWRGSKHVERAVIVGTPNLGFLNVCFEMTQGLSMAPGVRPFPPAMIGTWATYYQMLPFPCMESVTYPNGTAVDLYDPQVWLDLKWGLVDPDQDEVLKILLPKAKTFSARRKIAMDHLQKCLKKAEKFSRALQVDSNPPDNLTLFLFLGDSVSTRSKAVVNRRTGNLEVTHMDGGDGVVQTISARMDTQKETVELPFKKPQINWYSLVHLNAAHMGITETPGFGDNVTYYLMLLPTRGSFQRRQYLKKALGKSPKYMKYFKKYDDKYK